MDCLQGVELLNSCLGERDNNKMVMALIENTDAMKKQIFTLGASDYITSPLIEAELFVRIKSAFCLKQLYQSNQSLAKPHHHLQPANGYEPQMADWISTRDTELVNNTCQYLLGNLAVSCSLDQLAHRMATNRNTLSSSFKRVLGRGVFAWLREQRMSKAENLLKTTDLSVQHICYEVGYNDPANFSTAFKTYFKLAPQQYRKK